MSSLSSEFRIRQISCWWGGGGGGVAELLKLFGPIFFTISGPTVLRNQNREFTTEQKAYTETTVQFKVKIFLLIYPGMD